MLATVTDKGQITVPKEIRDRLNIRPGTRLDFVDEGDGRLTVRVMHEGSASLRGLARRVGHAGSALTPGRMEKRLTDALLEDDARIRAGRLPQAE